MQISSDTSRDCYVAGLSYVLCLKRSSSHALKQSILGRRHATKTMTYTVSTAHANISPNLLKEVKRQTTFVHILRGNIN